MATSLRGPDLMLEQYPGRIEAIETTPDAPTANVGAPQAHQMQQGVGRRPRREQHHGYCACYEQLHRPGCRAPDRGWSSGVPGAWSEPGRLSASPTISRTSA